MKCSLSGFLLLFLVSALPTQAQMFKFPIPNLSFPAAPAASPASTPAAPASAPAGTSAAPASVSHAPVLFNNRPLFQVSAATDRAAQDRADLANLRLTDALSALTEDNVTRPPQVTVGTDKAMGSTVLRLDGQPLLTVTQADADTASEDAQTLAGVWAREINAAFRQALRERTPGYLRRSAIEAGVIVLVGAVVQLLLRYGARRWHGDPGWPIQVLLWLMVVRSVLFLFPQTRPVDTFLLYGVARPFTILLDVGLLAAVLSRVWKAVLRRLFPPIPDHLSHEEWGRRTVLRRATLASIARVTGAAVIWFVAGVSALGWAGVNLSALLTSAGLLGVGIGLATQDMMKDLVAGINILADDRFGVGDTIQMGEYEGRVEKLDLRITQVRDLSGRLITIPNRNIAQVANLTSRWAQVDLRIGVSYFDDLRRAMDVMTETAESMHTEFPNQILDSPQMLGVDSFNDTNITLRMLIRTVPGDQWHVARELRARIKEAFDKAGIAFLNALHTEPKSLEQGPTAAETTGDGAAPPDVTKSA
jgi:small-conductance mechanosensitive channel